jgi:hypothetical protein
VKAKIGEWEQLFMQLSASREQIERTVQAAKKRVRQISAQKEKMRESLRLSEDGLSPGQWIVDSSLTYEPSDPSSIRPLVLCVKYLKYCYRNSKESKRKFG